MNDERAQAVRVLFRADPQKTLRTDLEGTCLDCGNKTHLLQLTVHCYGCQRFADWNPGYRKRREVRA